MLKAACFSVAAIDYFPQQEQFFAGGNALNQAVRLASLGVSTTFLGALGNDKSGMQIRELLDRHGVNTALLETVQGKTANNRIVNDAYGERYGEEGAWDGGVFDGFRISEHQWLAISDHPIWTTHASCPNFSKTLTKKSKNNFLCVDYLHLPNRSELVNTVEYVDIAYIGGDESMVSFVEDLSVTVDTPLVLTMGAHGSIAFLRGEQFKQTAITQNTIVDTTGCGDAFQAAFTVSYYQEKNISKALVRGAEQAALATRHYGGVQW